MAMLKRNVQSKVSSWTAFVTFFKSLFGAGLLALPNAFGKVGLVLGAIMFTLVGIACVFSCYLLITAIDLTNASKKAKESIKRTESGLDVIPLEEKSSLVQQAEHAQSTQPAEMPETYGDLAEQLLGHKMGSIVRWTIIVLSFLFTTGFVIVIIENISSVLKSIDHSSFLGFEFHQIWSRHTIGFFLIIPIIIVIQIPLLGDMYFVSALALAVYIVGVMGSSVLAVVWGGNSTMAQDDLDKMWDFRWNGVPTFIGTAVYALEGISLALPTYRSMENPSDANKVVCGALTLYMLITTVFAVVAYAGGLGGDPITTTFNDNTQQDLCDVVTDCIEPNALRIILQIALSVALLLTIPVMLYPATEMLEMCFANASVFSTSITKETVIHDEDLEGSQYLKTLESSSFESLSLVKIHSEEENFDDEDSTNTKITNPSVTSNTKMKEISKPNRLLRLTLALLILILAVMTPSFTLFSSFVGAVGLTFAGFIVPPILYFIALRLDSSKYMSFSMILFLMAMLLFGIFNMVVGGSSSFKQLVRLSD